MIFPPSDLQSDPITHDLEQFTLGLVPARGCPYPAANRKADGEQDD